MRYVDPAYAGREEPNFFSRMFSFGKKSDDTRRWPSTASRSTPKGNDDARSRCSIRRASPRRGEAGKRIVNLLLEDLR